MELKLLGAILIVAGCGGYGFSLCTRYRKRERALSDLVRALDRMECELQYRLTPLPELCRQTAAESGGRIREVFTSLAGELENQVSPEVRSCMNAALCRVRELPERAKKELLELGQTLGRFDLPGQLKGLEAIRRNCRSELDELSRNREVRLRSYQTLGLCAGAALAILFL